MGRQSSSVETSLLLAILDQAYDKRAWHGTNLRGAIRGLSSIQASWRPGPGRYCIADQVMHAAYWKYAVRRRLLGEKRGSYPVKGSNWFPLPEWFGESEWRRYVKLLDEQHGRLREAVAAFPSLQLHAMAAGRKWTPAAMIYGIASHDLYHTGQIQLLKRLQASA